MSFRKFGKNDFFTNTVRSFPKVSFYIHQGKVYYNNVPEQDGVRNQAGSVGIPQVPPDAAEFNASATVTNTNTFKNVRNIGSGHVSLYEYNIDRPYLETDRIVGSFTGLSAEKDGNFLNVTSYSNRKDFYDSLSKPIDFVQDLGIIYPYISKNGARSSWKTVTSIDYSTAFKYGDVLTATYPLSASVSREYITHPSASDGRYNAHYVALRNRLNYYGYRSRAHVVSSSLGNKNEQTLNLISIPSIFYGTKINPGSISLRFYISGSMVGELKDYKQNGELVQVGPPGSTGTGSVAGVALYDEGIVLLTGSWSLNTQDFGFIGDSTTSDKPRWIYYGVGMHDSTGSTNTVSTFRSASFDMSFNGHTETQVMTMFAHANRGQANYSNNPTYIQKGQQKIEHTSSHVYEQKNDILIKNIVSSSYSDYAAPFKRQVFISRIGVYDQYKNLIGLATLSRPILKNDTDDISFKLKIDI